MLNIKVVSWSLGTFTAISFVACVLYGLIVPRSLHGMAPFLEMVLPAFQWLTLGGFCLGLIESFLYCLRGSRVRSHLQRLHPPLGHRGSVGLA